MRKSVLLSVLAAACVISIIPSHAATSSSSSSGGIGGKMKNGGKAVGRGIMWGPKKIGAGFKSLGNKMHKGNGSAKKSP